MAGNSCCSFTGLQKLVSPSNSRSRQVLTKSVAKAEAANTQVIKSDGNHPKQGFDTNSNSQDSSGSKYGCEQALLIEGRDSKFAHIDINEAKEDSDRNSITSRENTNASGSHVHEILSSSSECLDSGDDTQGTSDREPLATPPTASSQTTEHPEIVCIAQRVDSYHSLVEQLRQKVSEIEEECLRVDKVQAFGELSGELGKTLKVARNYAEDLLESMLGLDKLSDLTQEDRALRKMTIARIEPMLDTLDDTKSAVSKLQRKLEREDVTNNTSGNDGSIVMESLPRKAVPVETSEHTSDPCNTKDPMQSQQFQATSHFQHSVATPGADFWKSVPVSLRHQILEESDKYVMVARVKNLSIEDFTVELSNDMRFLQVKGLLLPTEEELAQLKETVQAHLHQLVRQSPQFCLHAKEIIGRLCAEAGNGCFGTFVESLQLPPDVDVCRIKSSYSGDLVRIVFPKMRVRPQSLLRPVPRYMGHLF